MEDEIRRRAYLLWEADGRPQGDGAKYWFRAVAEATEAAASAIKPAARKRAPRRKAAA